MQSEDGHAGGDEGHDGVFVPGVAAAEEGDVEGHDREQLAGFGEDEGDVVHVGEGGVAEGAGEGGR